MNCRGWNPHISLYVEGDLEPNLTRQLAAHLATCDECRRFAEELRETQRDVRELKAEIVEPAALSRVRARVLEQVLTIERRRRWIDRASMWLWNGFRWKYAMFGGVAMFAASAAVWRLFNVEPPAPPARYATATPAVVEPAPVERPVVKTLVKPRKPRRRDTTPAPAVTRVAAAGDAVAGATAPEHKETLVQILTDDPNVIIYWLIDETGGF